MKTLTPDVFVTHLLVFVKESKQNICSFFLTLHWFLVLWKTCNSDRLKHFTIICMHFYRKHPCHLQDRSGTAISMDSTKETKIVSIKHHFILHFSAALHNLQNYIILSKPKNKNVVLKNRQNYSYKPLHHPNEKKKKQSLSYFVLNKQQKM